MKPKYVERQIMLHGYRQLCSLHKKEHIHVEIAKDNEKSFDISKHELERQFSWGEHKNFIGLMKDELGGKIMTEFAALRPKTYNYLTDDDNENKNAKGTKKACNKTKTYIWIFNIV